MGSAPRVFRVGAYVDDVTYPCRLTVDTGGVRLQVGGPWAWLLRGEVGVVHRERPITVMTARFAVPWQRCAVLVFDEAHRALVLLSRRRCAEVLAALEDTTVVEQVQVPHLGRASVLLAQQQHHVRVASTRRRLDK